MSEDKLKEWTDCFAGTNAAGVAMELDELRRRTIQAEMKSERLSKACERLLRGKYVPKYLRLAIEASKRS